MLLHIGINLATISRGIHYQVKSSGTNGSIRRVAEEARIFKDQNPNEAQDLMFLIQSECWIDDKHLHTCVYRSTDIVLSYMVSLPEDLFECNCLAVMSLIVDPLISYSNRSHPLQHEAVMWSETHFCAQTALFPTHLHVEGNALLCVVWEERVVICPPEARTGLHTVGVARPSLQWRRL